MTATTPGGGSPVAPELITVTIDGFPIGVPKGTLVIRAAEQLGIQIPRFCDHPLLDPVGACRQCLVEIGTPSRDDPDVVTWLPKPQAACTITVSPGMSIRTQQTSAVADKAQQGIMEFLLINHPLDCPVCDKGGECPLQNQAMSNGRPESRFDGAKRTYPKPVAISAEVLLDRERCVLCARCTRFSQEIAGDPFIELLERGSLQQVGIYEKEPFESYFAGNTIQICPVGALTSADYRFRARPFDLVSTRTTCEHCACGCALRTDQRRGAVQRRLAWEDADVNEAWSCDKGRFAFRYADVGDRLRQPLVRDEATGDLVVASWPEAISVAAAGLAAARDAGGVGVLPGGRLTVEDAYAYAKFARVVLGTNDVDFRARAHSAEETAFLAAAVAGSGLGVTYADLQAAPAVLLAGLEPEDEAPIVFLRLRKAVRRHRQQVTAVAPFTSRGLAKLAATLLPAAPGTEAEVLDALASAAPAGDAATDRLAVAAETLRRPGAVILTGERLAATPGALSAALRLAAATGARLAWIPRRAGERGALDAGAFPTLLPGGRPVADPSARADAGAVWGVPALPAAEGRDAASIVAAAADGTLAGLLVGGVDPGDLPDPDGARAALAKAFVVSLELRRSQVTDLADVVLPVQAVAEKAGTFVDWEGRSRPFDVALPGAVGMPDARVLTLLAGEVGVALRIGTVDTARAEIAELGTWDGARPAPPDDAAVPPPTPDAGEAVLATWHQLLDTGRLQDGEPHLAATARRTVALMSGTTAQAAGVSAGDAVQVSTDRGAVTIPVELADLPDHVVWLPQASVATHPHSDLGATAGSLVRLAPAGPDEPTGDQGSVDPAGAGTRGGPL